MPSIVPGYEYDIFISYRQNDNKKDQWVTHFVETLQDELDATFKQPVSIYFDENPHDGLLETHQVDASLAKKLNCLIFMPIISQTYCDEISFAWQHEFLPFIEMAKEDELGMNITLNNGNVVSRILPVKIHDLDIEDQNTLEAVLNGPLRSIDFIYSEPGVNRPLRPNDREEKNLYKTSYRNQINKVANALKDIYIGIIKQTNSNIPVLESSSVNSFEQPKLKTKNKFLYSIIGVFLILLTAFLLYINQKRGETLTDEREISIVVLPFKNFSGNPEHEPFCDGMTDEVIAKLTKLNGINKVISLTSSMSYKGTQKTMPIIAAELDVTHILEANFQKSGDQVKITIQLIDGPLDNHYWSDQYIGVWGDIFDIQAEVANNVAKNMGAIISEDEIESLQERPTDNEKAYELYLMAASIWQRSNEDFKLAVGMLERAIQIDSGFVGAYTSLGFIKAQQFWWQSENKELNPEEAYNIGQPYLDKALELDSNNIMALQVSATNSILYKWDFQTASKIRQKLNELSPDLLATHYHIPLGMYKEALRRAEIAVKVDPLNTNVWYAKILSHYFNKEYDKTLQAIEFALNGSVRLPASAEMNIARVYLYMGMYDDVLSFLENIIEKYENLRENPRILGIQAIAYYHLGDSIKANENIERLKICDAKSSVGSPSFYLARVYAQMEEIDLAFEWLEKAYRDHELEMFWVKVEPPFDPLRDDPRWQKMLNKVGFPE